MHYSIFLALSLSPRDQLSPVSSSTESLPHKIPQRATPLSRTTMRSCHDTSSRLFTTLSQLPSEENSEFSEPAFSTSPLAPSRLNLSFSELTENQPKRKLSSTELFYYLAAQRHQGWGTSAICLRVRATEPKQEDINNALAYLKATHDMLDYHIEEIKSPPLTWTQAKWTPSENEQGIPVDIVAHAQEDDWKKSLNELIEKIPGAQETPLIQFKILQHANNQHYDVLLGFHHALTDGAGAWHLLKTFTQLCWPKAHWTPPDCHQSQVQAKPKITHPSEQNWQPKPKEIIMMLQRTLANLFRGFVSQLISRSLPECQSTHQSADKPLILERRIIPAKVLKQLSKTSRAKSCTLNASLTAAALCVSEHLFNTLGNQLTPIGYTVPVDLRNRLDEWPTHELGVRAFAINLMGFVSRREPQDIWALASTCRNSLAQQLAAQTPQSAFLLMEHLLKARIDERFIMANIPKDQILLNNLGRLPTPQTDDTQLRYEAISWGTNMGEQSPLVRFYFATLNDSLSLTVQSNRLPKEKVNELADAMIEKLHSMLEDKIIS